MAQISGFSRGTLRHVYNCLIVKTAPLDAGGVMASRKIPKRMFNPPRAILEALPSRALQGAPLTVSNNFRHALVSLLMTSSLACKQETQISGGAGKKQGATTSTPSEPTGNAKPTLPPTDDGEGLNGYLTSPGKVKAATRDDGMWEINGSAGAVSSDDQSPDRVSVGIWTVDARALDQPTMTSNQTFTVEARSRTCLKAQKDGSFTITSASLQGAVMVTAGVSCQASVIPVSRNEVKLKSIVRAAGQTEFVATSAQLESVCRCPTGQKWAIPAGVCRTGEDDICPSTAQASDGKVCGCDGKTYDTACHAAYHGIRVVRPGTCP